MKPVTSMMSLWSEMMVNFQNSHWKVKVRGLIHFKQNDWWCLCKSSEKQDLLLHKDFAKGKFSKSRRGNLVETIFAEKCYLFPSRSLDVSHFVMEIIRCLGLCNQTVETDALRLHWELIFWVWFDLGRLLRETVSISFSLLKVFMLFTINLFSLFKQVSSILIRIQFAFATCVHF